MFQHVDDLKISHYDQDKVTNFINWLGTKYSGLTVHKGKNHDYLGKDFDYQTPGVFTVLKTNYTNNTINNSLELIITPSAAPDMDHLFKTQSH